MGEHEATLAQHIEKTLQAWGIPGGAVTIVKDDATLMAQGYGVKDVTTGEAIDAYTAFAVGSCTKSITALGLGLLVQEGRMTWDDKIIQHLPDFALYDAWLTEHVTIRDMLSHRVGLQRAIRLYQKGDMPKSEIVHRMRYLQPVAGFRTDFCYGNPHYTLAGALIEAVSDTTWSDFLYERLFKPLGMKGTYTCYGDMLKATDNFTQVHTPHTPDAHVLIPQSAFMLAEQRRIAWQDIGNEPAGSVITTAHDMQFFLKMMLGGGAPLFEKATLESLWHPSIVPADYEASMFAPFVMLGSPTHFYAYGMGFYLFDFHGHKAVVGAGQIQGMNTAFILLPQENIGASVMLNTFHTLAHFGLILDIAEELLGKASYDWAGRFLGLAGGIAQQTKAQVDAFIASHPLSELTRKLTAYEGRYHHDLYGVISIKLEDERLFLSYGTQYAGTLTAWQDDKFIFNMTTTTDYDATLVSFEFDGERVVGFGFDDGAYFTREA